MQKFSKTSLLLVLKPPYFFSLILQHHETFVTFFSGLFGLLTPIIAGHVSPLEDTLSTSQILGELIVHFKDFGSWSWVVPGTCSIRLQKQIFVQAHLTGRLFGGVVGTDSELKVSHVIGSQFDANFDDLVHLVFAYDNSFAKLAAGFIRTRLKDKNLCSENPEDVHHIWSLRWPPWWCCNICLTKSLSCCTRMRL